MVYILNFSRQAFKELAKIKEPFYANIKKAIVQLVENPRPHGCKRLKGRNGYRIRIGNYRVVYDIFDSELVIDIINVGHRKDVYE